MATAPIRPIAWEPPYAMGVALEKGKKTKKKQNPAGYTPNIGESAPNKLILPQNLKKIHKTSTQMLRRIRKSRQILF